MNQFLIIDIGGTYTKIYLLKATINNQISVSRQVVKTISIATQKSFLDFLRKLKQAELSNLSAVVVGIPGEYDRTQGELITSPNIPSWKGFRLRENLQHILCDNIFIENDVNLSAMGEIEQGAGITWKNFVYLAIGTGLGGGVVINSNIITGSGGGAGEIGHMLIHPDGELCGCGRRGCLEAYASGTGIIKNFKRLGGKKKVKTSEEIYSLAEKGDLIAIKAFEEMGKYLGWGIANIVNILEPEGIIIAGGVTSAKKFFLSSMQKAFQERAFTTAGRKIPIIFSKLKYPPLWGGIHKLKREGLLPSQIKTNLSL